MKICMIIPPKVNGKWISREDKHAGEWHGELSRTPYTAMMLFALIEEHLPEDELYLVEAQRDNLSVDEVKEKIDTIKPEIIITYLSCYHIPQDRICAELNYPSIAIIVPQTIDQKEALGLYQLKTKYICKNEIEMPIINALKEYKETGIIEKTKGFLINTPDGIIDTGQADLADLSDFPMPAFDAFELGKYLEQRKENKREKSSYLYRTAVVMNTMKGCLFNCTFCAQGNIDVRYQTPRQVLEQIIYLKEKYKITTVYFIDNEFGVSLDRAKEICLGMIHENLYVKYAINNRIELFDDELINLLAKSGCENVRLGIETCDKEVQKYINKKIDLNRAKKVIKKLKDTGLQVHLYFISGLPGETKKVLKLNAKFIVDTESDFGSEVLFPAPNSIMYKEMKNSGRLLEKDWSYYHSYQKMVYKGGPYKTIGHILDARTYMKRLVHLYRIRMGWQTKDWNLLLLSALRFAASYKYIRLLLSKLLPKNFRNKIKKRIF